MSFSTNYNIKSIKDVSDQNSPIRLSQVKWQYDENIIRIFRTINKKHFQNDEHLLQYVRTKLINIIDPTDYFIRDNEYILVFKDFRQYRFPEQDISKNEKLLKIILFQLALALDELQERNIKWYINSLSQIYLINQTNVFLSMIDFEDTYFLKDYDNFNGFSNLIKYINDQGNLFKNLLSKNNFREIIHELQASLTQPQQSISNSSDPEYPEESLIKQMRNMYFPDSQEKVEQCGDYNVINVQTPNFFKIIFGIDQDQIQYRYYSFKNFGTQQEINQNREYEYQYKFITSDHVEKIICYLKIYGRVVFFYKKPHSSLKQAFHNLKQQMDKQFYKKICFKILKDLLLGIQHLHQNNIIHRNLSPETCFLTNEKLDELNTYFIGQIGTSKKLKDIGEQVLQTDKNCQLFDYFMPPDDISKYSDKTDVFLFGLLALYVMNQGKMLYNNSEFGKKQYKENFSSQNIQNKLKDYNYDQELINMISQCLEFEPEKRPSINDIQTNFHKLDQQSKIKISIIQQKDGGMNS